MEPVFLSLSSLFFACPLLISVFVCLTFHVFMCTLVCVAIITMWHLCESPGTGLWNDSLRLPCGSWGLTQVIRAEWQVSLQLSHLSTLLYLSLPQSGIHYFSQGPGH